MLSDTFKYISQFRHAGHQVGRKVGDMLELLTYAGIEHDTNLKNRLRVEPKLFGYSDAGHKVEFVVEKNLVDKRNGGEITNPSQILGFIECKKVGVEQTVQSKFKKQFSPEAGGKGFKVPFEKVFEVGFQKTTVGRVIYFVSVSPESISVTSKSNEIVLCEKLERHHRIIFCLTERGDVNVLGNQQSLRDINDPVKNARIFDVFEITADGVIGVLNDCLAGPQTPEKAKQASFVALDVRKKRFNSFDLRPKETEMPSILVLTEFAHWEQKSVNMITACIDYNLVVSDELIVDAFMKFESEFGKDFYSHISKDSYETNNQVAGIVGSIVNAYGGQIFKDISDGKMKSIRYKDSRLIVE